MKIIRAFFCPLLSTLIGLNLPILAQETPRITDPDRVEVNLEIPGRFRSPGVQVGFEPGEFLAWRLDRCT